MRRLTENERSSGLERIEPNFDDGGITCPACGAVNTSDTKFCVSCGTAFVVTSLTINTCGNCGESVGGEMKFCARCGAKLKDDN